MKLIDCPECGRVNNASASVCRECHSSLEDPIRSNRLTVGSIRLRLGLEEDLLSMVDGGLRALRGRSFLWDVIRYYLLGHRASFAITNKRFINVAEKTRDHTISTVQVRNIASISVGSDFLIIRLIMGLLYIYFAFYFTYVSSYSYLASSEILFFALLCLLGGITAIFTSKTTSVLVESVGGRIFAFSLAGVSQKNAAIRAVDKINLEMASK